MMRVLVSAGAVAVMLGVGLLAPGLSGPYGRTGPAQVLIIHHATANQGVDAREVRIGDCATQRNLSDEGRLEAKRMGASLLEHGFIAAKIVASPFCRTVETARLMNLGPVETARAFENLRADQPRADALLSDARAIMKSWQGPGPLLIVTHSSTIKALTGIELEPGKFIAVTNPASLSMASMSVHGDPALFQPRTF